ncbi:MAG: transcription-repair coupling factor [Gammaproteobacteria bacterium]
MTTGKISPLALATPATLGELADWDQLYGSSPGLAVAIAAQRHTGPVVVVAEDSRAALRIETEVRFFSAASSLPLLDFPDWETLPYDHFSPHQDIVSQRLTALYRLPTLQRGVLVVPAATLMQRMAPRDFLEANSLLLKLGDNFDINLMRARLEAGGYRCVAQVMEHGEFAVRGALIDLFPMGSEQPYRIDLFDDQVETIRTFDPETQRTLDKITTIQLLPAREFPLTEAAITRFRQAFRQRFEGDPNRSPIYRDVSRGLAPAGIEYYLPLFFEQTATLFDYLAAASLIIRLDGSTEAGANFWAQAEGRYEQLRHDLERPLLPPSDLFLSAAEVAAGMTPFAGVKLHRFEQADTRATRRALHFASVAPPPLPIDGRSPQPIAALRSFLDGFSGRVLFAAESAGRREALLDLLRGNDIQPQPLEGWQAFLDSEARIGITVAALEQGLVLTDPLLAVIAEPQLFGARALQQRRRKAIARDAENVVRNLAELALGAPVVHENHGVGRYLGLQMLTVADMAAEFLTLEYAGGDKLYVPVSSLHLISRYTGAAADTAPLHKLGGDQWARAKRKAAERVRDVAAELLDIYARRALRQGHAFQVNDDEYSAFAAAFPFEETPDQQVAIEQVLGDLASGLPMDRVVCGDVGFGKTEVAMRAAFVAVQGGRQVVVLVPTTLLAQQHAQNFRDRFADWPVRIESMSRFSAKKEQDAVLKDLAEGKVDIVIGTHKLLQEGVRFKNLGLVILDEEHRFGVRQKERLKALRAEVDVLTLTATPIPRTLNMALSGLRELSIIATPPPHRHAIKTFVTQWNDALMREACLREIGRGGQVYFLHNEVETIERAATELQTLMPEAAVRVAHGQMRERDLEQVMLDFYHRRFNILVCSTIIESGIDVPSANTIIIQRADKLGLAQLHQLRGRVGRSHHRAYAYLVVPPRGVMSADAVKRLEAVEALEDLGAGFLLATNDLEIRGAGELLGEEQSGQIHEIGFSLYSELLERAVHALKAGRQPELDRPLDHGPEIDLRVVALIPDTYLPDVHARLILYKRIAGAASDEQLRELQVEMIDRFGLLPEPVKNLFSITALKIKSLPLGVRKIEAGETGGRIVFTAEPNIDPLAVIRLIQDKPNTYKLDGKDKLRFTLSLPALAERVAHIEALLEQLTPDAGTPNAATPTLRAGLQRGK